MYLTIINYEAKVITFRHSKNIFDVLSHAVSLSVHRKRAPDSLPFLTEFLRPRDESIEFFGCYTRYGVLQHFFKVTLNEFNDSPQKN